MAILNHQACHAQQSQSLADQLHKTQLEHEKKWLKIWRWWLVCDVSWLLFEIYNACFAIVAVSIIGMSFHIPLVFIWVFMFLCIKDKIKESKEKINTLQPFCGSIDGTPWVEVDGVSTGIVRG